MGDVEYLQLELDFWDDFVGAFEPAKVIRQLRRTFPQVDVDPTDQQEVRLLRELESWSRDEIEPARRDKLIWQSKNNYRTNGPTYRFVIPFDSDWRVPGWARRLRVGFETPAGLPKDYRDQLLAFLRSLKMGEPVLGEPVAEKHTPKENEAPKTI